LSAPADVNSQLWNGASDGYSPPMSDAQPAPDDVLLVLVTVPDAETGARIGRSLVEARLAACVSLVPGLRSIYRWEGAVQDEAETLCLIKTRRPLYEPLRKRIETLHPYQTPEIIGLAPLCGNEPYLRWIWDSTAAPP
jgi:periplasmic divalent cation tolerance protein